ncbi:uncharacterized protein TNCV_2442421 [Trichonephila clavipes]|nr:uncharacterized protein TNCV_2442421 [Trichonephila clavipes]
MTIQGPILLSSARIVAVVQVGNLELSPYSPDLTPINYLQFPTLKDRWFSLDSDVKTFAETWLNERGPNFYYDELNKLVLLSDKCMSRLGDYAKK